MINWKNQLNSHWNFFQPPDADVQKFLDVYDKHNTVDFDSREDALTNALIQRTLRRARLNYKLRNTKLVWKAFKRFWMAQYARYVLVHYVDLKNWLYSIAKKEEALAKPAEEKIDGRPS